MTDHDHLFDEPAVSRGAIRVDLEGLARAMPDDPDRVRRVLAGAARHERHRQATRVVAVAALAAAMVGGLVAVRTHAPGAGTSAAGATPDVTAATTLPAKPAAGQGAVTCSIRIGSNGPTNADGVVVTGGAPAPGAGGGDANGPGTASADDVKSAAIRRSTGGEAGGSTAAGPSTVKSGDGAGAPADRVTVMKGLAAVTAVDDTSITVRLDGDEKLNLPSSITATFTETTVYRDADGPVTARPTIVVGDAVLIAVEQPAGGDARVLQLEAHPSLVPAGPGSMAIGTIDGLTVTNKVQGAITGVDGDTITVTVAEGSLPVGQSIVVHVPNPTAASTIGTPCGPPPSPAVGDQGSFLLGAANPDGSYPAVLAELRHG